MEGSIRMEFWVYNNHKIPHCYHSPCLDKTMKLIVVTFALFDIVTAAGENDQSQMVLDAQKILRVLEDMLVCQELDLPIEKMFTCFAKMHVRQAQSPVDELINEADESQTIEQQSTSVYSNNNHNSGPHRLPCRRTMRWSC